MLKLIFCCLLMVSTYQAYASDDHKEDHKEEKGSAHEEHDEHDDHDEKKSSSDGFKLNQASIKTFELKFLKFSSQKTLIPKNAIYKGLNEVNIYRLRNQFFKRIDFKIVSQNNGELLITSPELKVDDEIVINGIGFLRMAEIAATGGLESSHSH